MNDKYVGKATPDMFGVVVHANIISMILNKSFVNQSNIWLEYLISIILCFISVATFHFVLDWIPQLFDPFTKAIQLIAIVVLIYCEMIIYYKNSFKIDLGLALAAVALAPDFLEIYIQLVKRFVTFLYNKAYITIKLSKLK